MAHETMANQHQQSGKDSHDDTTLYVGAPLIIGGAHQGGQNYLSSVLSNLGKLPSFQWCSGAKARPVQLDRFLSSDQGIARRFFLAGTAPQRHRLTDH